MPHGFEVSQQVRSAKGERECICPVFSSKLFMILGFLEFKKLVGTPVDHPQKTGQAAIGFVKFRQACSSHCNLDSRIGGQQCCLVKSASWYKE